MRGSHEDSIGAQKSFSHEGPIKGPSAHVELRLKEPRESPSRSRVLRGWRLEDSGKLWVVGSRQKVRHRCELGISVLREAWCRGIGRAPVDSALECARQMGFAQVELEVVGDNERAIALYRSLGFIEFGRNPLAFKSRTGAWQELVSMRLRL